MSDLLCTHEGCQLQSVGNKGLCARHMAQAQPRSKPVTMDAPVETAASEAVDEAKFASDTEVTTVKSGKLPKVREQAEIKGPDPEVVGARIAEMIVAQQRQEARRKMQRKQVPRDPETGERLPVEDEPPRVPLKLYSKRKRRDSTAIVDPATGDSLLKRGWVGRWVRQVDHRDRPTEQRMVEMEDYGYEIVRLPGTDEPLISNLGIAMQAPPEQYALRCVEKSVPGAIRGQEQVLEDTQQMVENLNQMAGEEVARFVQAKDHGKETTEEPVFRRGG